MDSNIDETKKALDALHFIIPILEKYKFQWLITGGFACYVYGVKRPLTDIDIDIDIDTSKDSPEFKGFLEELKPLVTEKLNNFVDKNYDNWTCEITFQGQVIDICPIDELKIFNKECGVYEFFYTKPLRIEMIAFHGLQLPLLPKDLIIKNKEMLVWQRESDLQDIEGLKTL